MTADEYRQLERRIKDVTDYTYESYRAARMDVLQEIVHKLPELVEVHEDVTIIEDQQLGMERITYRGYDVAYIRFDLEEWSFFVAVTSREKLKSLIKQEKDRVS